MALFDDDFLRRLETLRVAFARRAMVEREGDRTTRRPGESMEFASHRAYSSGDDPARIDWHAYARLGELFIKQFQRPSTEALHIVIDTSASMEAKLAPACRIAASMVFVAAAGYARVELSAGGNRVTPSGPTDALRFLEGLSAGGDADPGLPEQRRAVVMISDFWIDEEVFFRQASQFRAQGGELSLIHILSAEEVEPSLEGAVTLVDVESGERKKLFAGPEEREAYARRLAAYSEALRREAARISVPYVRVRSDEPIEVILFDRMRAAGILD